MHFMNLRVQEHENKHDYKLVSISQSADFLRQWGGHTVILYSLCLGNLAQSLPRTWLARHLIPQDPFSADQHTVRAGLAFDKKTGLLRISYDKSVAACPSSHLSPL